MPAKFSIDAFFQPTIAGGANANEVSPIVPNGKTFWVKKFGCFDPNTGDNIDSIILIQWGSTGSWNTIRAAGGGTHEFEINSLFLGDGTKRFRILIQNKSGDEKTYGAWFSGVVRRV